MLKYTAWIHWHITRVCNFNCEYCFSKMPLKNVKLKNIDYQKILNVFEKTKKIFRLSFTGGEPTLIPNFTEAIENISKEHFLSFNSNLVSTDFNDFVVKINPERIIEIHASFHFHELKRRGLLELFFKNYLMLKEAGFDIYAEQVAYPLILKEANQIKEQFQKNNIEINFSPFLGKYKQQLYPENYLKEEIKKFGIKNIDKFEGKGELCNAGFTAAVAFSNGDIYKCFNDKKKLGNLFVGIDFLSEMEICKSKVCGCPLKLYDKQLFDES